MLLKKLEIERTMPTTVMYYQLVGLIFSISKFFINKISQGRNQSVHGLLETTWLFVLIEVKSIVEDNSQVFVAFSKP